MIGFKIWTAGHEDSYVYIDCRRLDPLVGGKYEILSGGEVHLDATNQVN